MSDTSSANVDRIAEIDWVAAQGWPATEAEQAAGCLLRHSPMLNRSRSNSALPLLGEDRSPAERISAIESFYVKRNQPSLVQLTEVEQHAELDQALDSRGYRRHSPTLVLTTTPAAIIRAGKDNPAIGVTVHKRLHEDWSALLHESAGGHDPAVEHTMPLVPDPVGFAVARLHNRPVGIALFPAFGTWTGVFCMVTMPRARRQGVAGALLRAGARWAIEQGDDRLYLQVTEDNQPARNLYIRHGFRLSHRYHYRQAS